MAGALACDGLWVDRRGDGVNLAVVDRVRREFVRG